MNAQQFFKELASGTLRPLYLVVGEEPFQMNEIADRARHAFAREDALDHFRYESWDGESLEVGRLLDSLNTLPGLFDDGGKRLVMCSRFDRLSPSAQDELGAYFENPAPSTCFLAFASKVDRRRAWVGHVEKQGGVLEISEPRAADWPRWKGYFERKIGKSLTVEAWDLVVELSAGTLSLVAQELLKAASFVGEKGSVDKGDILAVTAGGGGADIFDFVDDVAHYRRYEAMNRYEKLLRLGEAPVKLLALLVRQFRLIDQYLKLEASGVSDPKKLGQALGLAPFLVARVREQSRYHDRATLAQTVQYLAECDYRLKTGAGSLFEDFLAPYFAALQHRREQAPQRP